MSHPHQTRWILIIGVGIVALTSLVVWFATRQPPRGNESDRVGTMGETLHLPSAQWTPQDVVRHQLTALRQTADQEAGIRQCYQFASPFNRASTGPIARFESMVRSPPYNVLLHAADMLVGTSVVREDRAAVLVTIVDAARSVHVFRFILSKQQQAPYEGCWMTDAVYSAGL